MSQLATALPQRQLGAAPAPRPVAQPAASSLGAFSPAYNQQINFGGAGIPQQAVAAAAAPQIRGRQTFQPAQPIIISQPGQTASPATSNFASLAGVNAFGGAGRQILTLRSPNAADDDEYEYEDDDEPTIQGRPSPRPVGPVTRTPVRVAGPSPSLGLGGARFQVSIFFYISTLLGFRV